MQMMLPPVRSCVFFVHLRVFGESFERALSSFFLFLFDPPIFEILHSIFRKMTRTVLENWQTRQINKTSVYRYHCFLMNLDYNVYVNAEYYLMVQHTFNC